MAAKVDESKKSEKICMNEVAALCDIPSTPKNSINQQHQQIGGVDTTMASTPAVVKEQRIDMMQNSASFSVSSILLRPKNDETHTAAASATSTTMNSTTAASLATATKLAQVHDGSYFHQYMLLQQLLLGGENGPQNLHFLQQQLRAAAAATATGASKSVTAAHSQTSANEVMEGKKCEFVQQLGRQIVDADESRTSSASVSAHSNIVPTSLSISAFLCAAAAAAAHAATQPNNNNGNSTTTTTVDSHFSPHFVAAAPQSAFPWQHLNSSSSSALLRPVPSYALPTNILANLQRQQQHQQLASKTYEHLFPPALPLPPFLYHNNNNLPSSNYSHVLSAASNLKQFVPHTNLPFVSSCTVAGLPSSAFERPFHPVSIAADEKKPFQFHQELLNDDDVDDDAACGTQDDDDGEVSDDENLKISDDDDDEDDGGLKKENLLEMMTPSNNNGFHHHHQHNSHNHHRHSFHGRQASLNGNNAAGISSSSACGKKKKTRTVFSRNQVFQLETAFEMKRYLNSSDRAGLANSLSLSEQQIKIWFQNRRNKWKRQYSTDFTTDPSRRLGSIGQCPTQAHQPMNNGSSTVLNLPTSPSSHHHLHHQHAAAARYAALSQLAMNSAMMPHSQLPPLLPTEHQHFPYSSSQQLHPLPSSLTVGSTPNSSSSSNTFPGIAQPLAKFNNASQSQLHSSFLPPPTSSTAVAVAAMLAGNHQQHQLLAQNSFYAAAMAAAAAAAATGTTSANTRDSKANSSSPRATTSAAAAMHAAAMQSIFGQQVQQEGSQIWPLHVALPTVCSASISLPKTNASSAGEMEKISVECSVSAAMIATTGVHRTETTSS